jgi:hypothetical protein
MVFSSMGNASIGNFGQPPVSCRKDKIPRRVEANRFERISQESTMEKIWIIGVGQFGFLAFERLSAAGAKRQFVLVDPVEQNLLKCDGPNCIRERANGAVFLKERLKRGASQGPDWIIPALPVHLAAEWLLLVFGPDRARRIPLPPELDRLLPNAMRGPDGDIYISHADFQCPADCAEPRDLCTVTGEKRRPNLFDILSGVTVEPFRSLNLRSHQLGPGIGGYRPEHLFLLQDDLDRSRGSLMVSTACRCHGVMTGIERL